MSQESKLLIVKNITREGPGLLEQIISQQGIDFDIVNLDARDQWPEDVTNYGAVIVLGGPDSANDTTPKMIEELDQVRRILEANIPYLGICLGLQVAVKAADGKVVPGAMKEIGFIDPDSQQYSVELTEAGENSPLLRGLSSNLTVFQLHGETVELTPRMTLLATGKFCTNQIVQVGPKAYGIQSHFELTPEMLRTWANEDPDLIPLGNDRLQTEFSNIADSYTAIGQQLFRNFLSI